MSIQGHLLEVTVVGCNRLRDTEWITRQDPYVCLEYASTKFRTRTCTDGGKNPSFQEKFVFNLIEGLREISISVWNSNTITFDDLIGSGKAQLHKVLSHGFDDTPWTIHGKGGKHAGDVTLIMHYSSAQKPGMSYIPTAPPMSMVRLHTTRTLTRLKHTPCLPRKCRPCTTLHQPVIRRRHRHRTRPVMPFTRQRLIPLPILLRLIHLQPPSRILLQLPSRIHLLP